MIEAHAKFERFLAEVSFICPECGEKNIRNYSPDGVYSLLECLGRDKCDKCGVELEIYESNEPVGEIVRCRDCRHYYEAEEYHPSGNYFRRCCKYFDTYDNEVELDGFCAWGERREGAES